MIDDLRQAVVLFRLGMDGGGSAALATFIDGLLVSMSDPEAAAIGPRALPLLKEIIAGQQRGDFLCVADILEYEVLPLLERQAEAEALSR
jgi:hypothetical protein